MIRRLIARIHAWLDYNVITEAPAGDLGSLDVRNGLGECPPLTDAQAARLMRDIQSAPFADWEETRAKAEFDNHVNEALEIVSPWNDADRASAAAMGVVL